MKTNTRAFAFVPVLLVIAAVTGVAWIAKPSLFPGSSRRAAVSTQTTANLVTAETHRDATAAASVVKIQEANAAAPESPAKSFISQETALTLTNLPAPDAAALLEAERRRADSSLGYQPCAVDAPKGCPRRQARHATSLIFPPCASLLKIHGLSPPRHGVRHPAR